MLNQKELIIIDNLIDQYFEIIKDDILISESFLDIPKEKALNYLKDLKKNIIKKDINSLKRFVKKFPKKLNTEKIINKIKQKNPKFKSLNSIAYKKLKSIMPKGSNDKIIKISASGMALKSISSKNSFGQLKKDLNKYEDELNMSLQDEYYQSELNEKRQVAIGSRIGSLIILSNTFLPIIIYLIAGGGAAFSSIIIIGSLTVLILIIQLIIDLFRTAFAI